MLFCTIKVTGICRLSTVAPVLVLITSTSISSTLQCLISHKMESPRNDLLIHTVMQREELKESPAQTVTIHFLSKEALIKVAWKCVTRHRTQNYWCL